MNARGPEDGAYEFRMPTLGADMEKGTLLEWFVAPGDEVHHGQVVAEIDTAKSAIEIEVFVDGTVEEICVQPGEEVPVGTVLARMRTKPAAGPQTPPVPRPAAVPEPEPAAAEPAAAPTPVVRHLAHTLGVDLAAVAGTGPRGRVTRADVERAAGGPARVPAARRTAPERPRRTELRASPLARRRAAEAGIDLATVRGTGPDGAVTAADVEAAAPPPSAPPPSAPPPSAPPPSAPPPSAPPPSGARARPAGVLGNAAQMRAAIGGLMSRSKREIPHYYLATTIDLQPLLDWLRHRNADLPVADRLMPAAAFLRATALAAAAFPDMNGHYGTDGFRAAPAVRLGVPVALRGGGLVTPVLDGAERMPLPELNGALRDVATRAKLGKLRAADLGDPTLTVTSLGERGVEAVFGVIYPPQVALVGFGGIAERPWAVAGLLGVRPVVTVTLAADHRVSDGHRGALFLDAIAAHLDTPEEL